MECTAGGATVSGPSSDGLAAGEGCLCFICQSRLFFLVYFLPQTWQLRSIIIPQANHSLCPNCTVTVRTKECGAGRAIGCTATLFCLVKTSPHAAHNRRPSISAIAACCSQASPLTCWAFPVSASCTAGGCFRDMCLTRLFFLVYSMPQTWQIRCMSTRMRRRR